jgi:hypothetical protein
MKRRLRPVGYDDVDLKEQKLTLADTWNKGMPCESCWQLEDCLPHCMTIREWIKNNPGKKKCL